MSPHTPDPDWQLIFTAPPFSIGVCCDEDAITSVAYLPPTTKPRPPKNMLAAECVQQLKSYFDRPPHRFNLPVAPARTAYQQRVRRIICDIPSGKTMRYGDVATVLKNSSPRAVGGACRANDIPLFVPCHRVVAANDVGGFMGDDGTHVLSIKLWLLRHEGAL